MLHPMRLRLLTELALRGTIAAVAEAVTLSPSAVSQQLAVLEKETKTTLLERYGRRVRLTAAGEALVGEAHMILAAIERAEGRLESLRAEITGPIRISSLPSAAGTLVPSVIAGLRRRYPLLSTHVHELETHEALRALRLADLDLAVIDDLPAGIEDPRIQRVALFEDPLVAVVPPDHPLRRAESVEIDRLRDAMWVMEEPDTTYCRFVTGLCRRAGFEPEVAVRARSIDVILAFIESGTGVSILPELHLRGTRRRIVHIPINPLTSRHVMIAIRRAGADQPAVQATLKAFTTSAAQSRQP